MSNDQILKRGEQLHPGGNYTFYRRAGWRYRHGGGRKLHDYSCLDMDHGYLYEVYATLAKVRGRWPRRAYDGEKVWETITRHRRYLYEWGYEEVYPKDLQMDIGL
jgi:hypothetical protein